MCLKTVVGRKGQFLICWKGGVSIRVTLGRNGVEKLYLKGKVQLIPVLTDIKCDRLPPLSDVSGASSVPIISMRRQNKADAVNL